MNIQIVAASDENFKIQVSSFGEQFLASDGERVCIEETPKKAEDCVEILQKGINPSDPIVVDNPRVAPLENSRKGHPFDPFGGTSWEGRPQGFN